MMCELGCGSDQEAIWIVLSGLGRGHQGWNLIGVYVVELVYMCASLVEMWKHECCTNMRSRSEVLVKSTMNRRECMGS